MTAKIDSARALPAAFATHRRRLVSVGLVAAMALGLITLSRPAQASTPAPATIAAAKRATVAVPAAKCPISAKLVPSCGVLLGISTERVGRQTWQESMAAAEKLTGRKTDVVHNYHLWNTAFPDAAEAAEAASGQKLLYSWIGKRQNGSTVKWASIASGAEDAVIDAEAKRIAAMRVPVYVNFQNEPESSIGISGTAAQYVAAWRHIHDRFIKLGAKNAVWTVVFMGVASASKTPQVKALYPGNAYVDWIAWDPYNWAGCRGQAWQSFSQIVTPFYSWLEANGYGAKPFMLAEFGTVEDPRQPAAKAAWFAGADSSLAKGEFPNLKVVSYFDHSANRASCDWNISTSARSAAAFKSLARNLGTRSTTPVTRPGAPTAVKAAAANLSATVTWAAPKATGGAPVTTYLVTARPGGKTARVIAPATTATVTGLSAGTAYTFTVTASNTRLTSPASVASARIVPKNLRIRVSTPTAATWQLNGTAAMAGKSLRLTDAAKKFSIGTAFVKTPISKATSVIVTFDAISTGGTGADGLALVFADADKGATTTSLGSSGGGLGWSGIPGFAVALDTYQNGTDPSSNFVGVATGWQKSAIKNLVWKATSSSVPSLRALRHVQVVITAGVLTASVDGTAVVRTAVHLPSKTLIGFSAADGNRTDSHTVSNILILAG